VEATFFASLDDTLDSEYEVKPYNTYPLDIDLTYDLTLGEKVDSEPIIGLTLDYGLMGGSDVIESLDDTIAYEYELKGNTVIELILDLLYDTSLGGYAESNLTMDLTFDSSVGSKSETELSMDLTYEYELTPPS
jgi:hypothetical protein